MLSSQLKEQKFVRPSSEQKFYLGSAGKGT
jgi:hypothetical protein